MPRIAAPNPQTDPLRFSKWASEYHELLRTEGGHATLHYWRGSFWRWQADQPRYLEWDFASLCYEVLAFLKGRGYTSNYRDAESVTHCLRSDIGLTRVASMPAWLDQERSHNWHLACRNCLIDPIAVSKGYRGAQSHTPLWFSSVLLPYDYDPEARCPKWEAWLLDKFEGDANKIRILQQFVGYWLTPDTSRQAALMLVGEAGTGKSTVAEVVKRLLGVENCSFVALSDWGDKFSLYNTLGRLLNISDEVGKIPAKAEAVFKMFINGMEMSFEEKNIRRRDIKPTARLLACVNEFPEFRDTTESVYRRIWVLPMEKKVARSAFKFDLVKEFEEELPGILNWAIAGLADLHKNNSFAACEEGERLLGQYRRQNQPFATFMEDCVRKGTGSSFLTTTDLVRAYKKWAARNQQPPTVVANTLSVALQRRFKAKPERRRIQGVQMRGLVGISLKE